MKKQILQDVVQSTHALGGGGKILKWWGSGYSRGGIHYVS
jgi:hypothetical protein